MPNTRIEQLEAEIAEMGEPQAGNVTAIQLRKWELDRLRDEADAAERKAEGKTFLPSFYID